MEFYLHYKCKRCFIEGAGTNDDDLIRVVVSRSERNMDAIKKEFEKLYGQSLAQFIEVYTFFSKQSEKIIFLLFNI